MRVITFELMAILCAGLLLSGCAVLTKDEFHPPKYDLRDTTVVVLPFRQGNLWHYESQDGVILGRLVAHQLQTNCAANLADDKIIEDEILQNFEENPPWSRWGRAAGADYLVLGTIGEIDFTKTKVIGMRQGTFSAEFEVWGVKEGKIVHYEPKFSIHYPRDPSKEEANVLEMSEKELLRKLHIRMSEKVSNALCGYTAPAYEDE